jgi:hypothetical protein
MRKSLALAVPLLLAPNVAAQSAAPMTAAGDGPGALSHFDLARKDCIGTARNTALQTRDTTDTVTSRAPQSMTCWVTSTAKSGTCRIVSDQVTDPARNTLLARAQFQPLVGSRLGVGLIPEQVWEGSDLAASPFGTDPTVASIGFRNGHPAGSAAT